MIDTRAIEKMSISERLQAMEQLWDALCRMKPGVASPDWHGAVLADRKARAKRGEAKFLTLEQVQARLQSSDQ